MHELPNTQFQVMLAAAIESVTTRLRSIPENHTHIDFSDFTYYAVSENNEAVLKSFGIRILGGNFGKRNAVFLSKERAAFNIELHVKNSEDGIVVLGGGPLSGTLDINGPRNICIMPAVGALSSVNKIRVEYSGIDLSFVCGAATTMIGAYIILGGRERSIVVGRDCMLSWGINIRNSDGHGIFDLESGDILNSPGNIYIDDHVWIGQDVTVMGQAVIGKGSIVGSRSLVLDHISPHVVCVGTPARTVGSNVSWSRSLIPSEQEIQAVRIII